MLMSVFQIAVKKCVGQPKQDQKARYSVLTMPLFKTNELLKKKQSWKRFKRKEIKEDSWERLCVRDVTRKWNRQWWENRLAEVELSEKVDTLGSEKERQQYWIRQILSKSNSRDRAESRGRDQQVIRGKAQWQQQTFSVYGRLLRLQLCGWEQRRRQWKSQSRREGPQCNIWLFHSVLQPTKTMLKQSEVIAH